MQKIYDVGLTGNRDMLIFATENPDPDNWNVGIAKFHGQFGPPLRPEGLTEPDEFPASHFIGVQGSQGLVSEALGDGENSRTKVQHVVADSTAPACRPQLTAHYKR